MRAERRREIEKQMAEGSKGKKTKKGGNGFFTFIAILYIAAAAAFLYYVFKLNVVPAQYLVAGMAVLAVITLFTVPVMVSKKGKHGRKIFATIIALLLIACFGMGTYYLSSTSNFLDVITGKTATVVTEDFHVLVRADDKPQEVVDAIAAAAEATKDEDKEKKAEAKAAASKVKEETAMAMINGKTIGTFTSNDQMYSKAKNMLQEKAVVEYAYDESVNNCLDKLLWGEYDAIFIPAASYEALKSEETYNVKKDTFILYTVQVPKETVDRTKGVNVTKESFNVYICGVDEGGIRNDVNMIATVNPVKHEVLLTSIPRDFYVTLPSKEAKDKLTHAGLYGIEEIMGAIENEFGIDLNYYVKVNYKAVRGVVDAIGGIDVESQYDFTTSGMGRLNGTHFTVGVNHMDGDMALAFCRERFVHGR